MITLFDPEVSGSQRPNVVAIINQDHKGRSPNRETVKSHQNQRRGKTI